MATTINTNNTSGYVEWSPVIAGSVLAGAVSLVLVQFGNTLGFSVPSRYDESYTAAKILIIGLWLLWMQLMASMSGAYLAGRMRSPWSNTTAHESDLRDGAHGLLVWALSSLVAAITAAIGAVLTTVAAHHGIDAGMDNETNITTVQAHRYAIIFGFGLTASYIVSAVASWWMGTLGGDHRDRSAGANLRISFRAAAKKAR